MYTSVGKTEHLANILINSHKLLNIKLSKVTWTLHIHNKHQQMCSGFKITCNSSCLSHEHLYCSGLLRIIGNVQSKVQRHQKSMKRTVKHVMLHNIFTNDHTHLISVRYPSRRLPQTSKHATIHKQTQAKPAAPQTQTNKAVVSTN